MSDLIIRGGLVVLPEDNRVVDVAIEDGYIVDIGPELSGTWKSEIDARGLTVLPGLIDVHVHFNEPGRTDWEGADTGSRAFAAGGGTLYFDMPLNSSPCTVDAQSFLQKRAALESSSRTDFALWGSIVPGNRDHLRESADLGAIGFKAFMADSGLPEFPRADDHTLFEGMKIAAELGLPVAVHAESEEIISGLTQSLLSRGHCTIRDYLQSRPIDAEVEAIDRAVSFAQETGARLHIVHVSSGLGVASVLAARARGVDVTIETCAHYLFLTAEDMERLGAVAKCAPPLRDAQVQAQLWEALRSGGIDIVASDHSPAPPYMKIGDNFFAIWGGIAGVQSTRSVLLSKGGLSLQRIAELTSKAPAQRFRIGEKGCIARGFQADVAIVDLQAEFDLKAEDLRQRHPQSPYLGAHFRGVVRQTLLRGLPIGGGAVPRFIRPTQA